MTMMFYQATSVNANFNNWNTSTVMSMNHMFDGATAFNGDISSWSVSKVADFNGMFSNTNAFNQDISGWAINTIDDVNMGAMFSKAKAFNQDISGWKMSKVTKIGSMFSGATAFNQNLGSWNLKSLTTAGGTFANSGMSCENYSLTLAGWANNGNTASGVSFGSQTGMIYSNAAVAKRAHLINNKSWTINGDNPAATNSACYNQSLAVGFGNITSILNHGELALNWSTLSEENTSHFIVEASRNGETFTKIGEVDSKAKNGISNEVLQYNFSVSTKSIAWMGLYAVALLGLAVGFTRRRNWILALSVLAIIASVVACSKNDAPTAQKSEKLYLRVGEVAKNGQVVYSKIIQAKNE